MPRGKKEPAEQIIPYAARSKSRWGETRRLSMAIKKSRCDGADVLLKRRSSTVASEKDHMPSG